MAEYVMAWVECHITTTAKYAEGISERLTACGALALTMKDAGNAPILEPALNKTPPLWPATTLIGLFDAAADLQPVEAFLTREQTAGRLQNFKIEALPDEDWERRCLDSFQPIQFGERLWVCPSWQTPPDPTAVTVILDPGLAFGTGTHATTALCLEWLSDNLRPDITVIDYGCGSGVLAVAALMLGASQAAAVDHDSKALLAAEENAQANHLGPDRFQTYTVDAFYPAEPCDLILANILAQPLIQLAPQLTSYVKKGGTIVLSGILRDQADEVSKTYSTWFSMQPIVYKEEWVRLTGIKQ
jgi:ribosomal protein L11 methyltransferase